MYAKNSPFRTDFFKGSIKKKDCRAQQQFDKVSKFSALGSGIVDSEDNSKHGFERRMIVDNYLQHLSYALVMLESTESH